MSCCRSFLLIFLVVVCCFHPTTSVNPLQMLPSLPDSFDSNQYSTAGDELHFHINDVYSLPEDSTHKLIQFTVHQESAMRIYAEVLGSSTLTLLIYSSKTLSRVLVCCLFVSLSFHMSLFPYVSLSVSLSLSLALCVPFALSFLSHFDRIFSYPTFHALSTQICYALPSPLTPPISTRKQQPQNRTAQRVIKCVRSMAPLVIEKSQFSMILLSCMTNLQLEFTWKCLS